MRIVVLGGSECAPLILGAQSYLSANPTGSTPLADAESVTAIVDTGGDIRLHNLQICPALDACLYAAAGIADSADGVGRAGDTWTVATELAQYDAEAPWFRLGDRDIATHLMRTRMLDAGYGLTDVTAALAAHWRIGVRLLPMTNDRVETHVRLRATDVETTADDAAPGGASATEVAIHVQEWRRRYHGVPKPLAVIPIGAEAARPAPGVLAAIEAADVILIAPSDRATVLDTIFAVPGIQAALDSASAPVVSIPPFGSAHPKAPEATDIVAAAVAAVAAAVADVIAAQAGPAATASSSTPADFTGLESPHAPA